jgi:hypothetical protein
MLSKILPRNENSFDRVMRVVLGLALLALVFVGPHSMWDIVGVVPLLTGLIGSCLAYTMLGISTCKTTT